MGIVSVHRTAVHHDGVLKGAQQGSMLPLPIEFGLESCVVHASLALQGEKNL